MRKFFFVLLLGASLGSQAFAKIYTTSCGEQYMGPDQEYFDAMDDGEEQLAGFQQDVNDYLCGRS